MGKESFRPGVISPAEEEHSLFKSFTPEVKQYLSREQAIKAIRESPMIKEKSKGPTINGLRERNAVLMNQFQEASRSGDNTAIGQLVSWGQFQEKKAQRVQRMGVRA